MEVDNRNTASSQEDNLDPPQPREPTPDEELNADIDNLSIEDSPAGPMVRIENQEVSTIPDSQPIHDLNNREKCKASSDSVSSSDASNNDMHLIIHEFCEQSKVRVPCTTHLSHEKCISQEYRDLLVLPCVLMLFLT